MSDFAHAVRALRKSPGFSLVAVLTIAVGIAANTALFSVYDRLVLNPVTIPDPSSLVAIWTNNPQLNFNAPAISWPRYEELREQARSFSSLGVSAFDNFTLTGNGDPEQLNGQRVSASFLPTLGVEPAVGRNVRADEDLPNGPAVCIISHELWQTRFGGRASLVGETITLNGQPWEVIGITPPRLSAPFSQVQVFAPRVFEVSGLTAEQIRAGAGYAQPIARLKAGVSLQQAAAELEAIGRASKERFATRLDANNTTVPLMFVAALVGNLEPTFYTLIGAVSFVLLIACANVTSLFLGRLTARQKESAVRQAIGAPRSRVVRQFLVESLVFSMIAGALGLLLAMWAVSAIQSIVATQLPPSTVITLNWRALLFTGGVTIVTALLVGLAPALQASRAHLVEVLKDSAPRFLRRAAAPLPLHVDRRRGCVFRRAARRQHAVDGELPAAAADAARIRSEGGGGRVCRRADNQICDVGAAGRVLRAGDRAAARAGRRDRRRGGDRAAAVGLQPAGALQH